MGKDTRINVTLDFNADLKNIQGAVGNIQKSLQGLSLPQGLNKNFLSLFSNLEAEVKNFGSLTSKELTTAGDFSAVEKSGKRILDLYRKLGVEIDSLSDTDKMKLFPPNTIADINKITNAMKQFNSATDKNKGAIAKAKENVAEYTAKLETQQKKMATLSNKTVLKNEDYKAAKEGLEEQRKAVEQLAQAYAEAEAESKQRMESSGRTTEDKRTKQYKEKIKIQAQLTEAQNNLNKAEQDFGNSISQSQYNSQMTKAQENTRKLELQLEQAAEELKNLGDGGAAEAFKKMMDSLKDVDGIDPSSIKSFEDLEQALQDIKNKAGADVDEKIEEIIAAMRAAQGPADQFGDNMREAGDSIKEMSREAQDLENLKHRILDFFSISNAVQLFKRAVKSAFDTVKELDATMTEAAVVTDFSVGDMWDKLPEYSAEASKLGAKINDLYGATTLYYQQGLKTNEAMQLGTETMKMARIAGMDSAAATEAMTAALRGFNMELNETSATKVNDVYSELAAITAADTEQIATAMSKTASIASAANMEFESTAAFLSQIIETTQEAPETAGTALKTIIARFSEVKALRDKGLSSGEDSEGEIIDVNKIQSALRTVGISMDEFFAGTEGLDSVLLKLASKWETLDFETQRYIATTAAGSRQQSRFIAMMSNYDRTMELVGAANNSAGASQEQFNKTLESLDSKLNNLKNAWDEFVMGLANNELIKAGVDILTGLLTTVNKIISSMSGGSGVVKTFVTAFAAIGAFKLGQKGLNKFLGNAAPKEGILAAILGKGKTGEAKTLGVGWGREAAGGFKDSFTKGAKDIFSGKKMTNFLFGNMGPIDTSSLKDSLTTDLTKLSTDQTVIEPVKIKLNEGDLQGAAQQMRQIGIDAGYTDQELTELGVNMDVINGAADETIQNGQKMGKTLGQIGTYGAMAGAALMSMIPMLEEMGVSDDAIAVIKGIAMALMALPVVMKVVEFATHAFAKGTTAAISSIPIIGWIAAAISALIALGSILATVIDTPEEKLKKAEQTLDEATAAAQEAAEEYNTLKDSLEEIREFDDVFDGLVRGTEAWRDAIIENNQKVLELIKNYKELAPYVENQNGRLVLNEEKKINGKTVGDVQNDYANRALEQQRNANYAGVVVEQRKYDIEKTEKINETVLGSTGQYTTYGTTGSDIGDTLTGAGLFTKTTTQGVSSYSVTQKSKDIVEQLALDGVDNSNTDEVVGYLKHNAAELGIKDFSKDEYEAFADYLSSLGTDFQDLSVALQTSTAALDAQNDMMASSAIDDFIAEQGINTATEEGAAQAAIYKDYATGEKYAELTESNTLTNAGNDEDFKQYVYDTYGKENVKSIGKDGTVELVDGRKFDGDTMTSTYASHLADKDIVEGAQGYEDMVSNISKGNAAVGAVLSGQQGTQLTQNDLEEVLGGPVEEAIDATTGKIEVDKGSDFYENVAAEYDRALKEAEKNGTKDEFIKLYGEKEDFIRDAYDKLNNGAELFLSNAQHQKELIQQGAQINETTTGLTASANEAVYSVYDQVAAQAGSEGVAEVSSNFEDFIQKDVDKRDQSKVADIFGSIDWTQADAIEQFKQKLEEAGLSAYIGTDSFNVLTQSLEKTTMAADAFDLSNVREQLKERLDLADEVKDNKTGTFDEETMKKLVDAGANREDFVWNGQEFVYIGGTMEDLSAAIESNTSELLANTAALLENKIKSGEEFSGIEGILKNDARVSWMSDEQKQKIMSGDFSEVSKSHKEVILEDIAAQNGGYVTDSQTGKQIKVEELDWIEDAALIERLLSEGVQNYNNLTENRQQLVDTQTATAVAGRSADEVAAAGESNEIVRAAMVTDANEAGLETSEVIAYADSLREVEGLSDQVADRIALDNSLMAQGLQEITENYDDWASAIKEGVGNPKYATAIDGLRQSCQKVLGTTEDLSEEWLTNTKNMELMKKAANGDEEALKDLRKSAAKEIATEVGLKDESLTEVNDAVEDFLDSAEYDNLEVGASLDSTGLHDSLVGLLEDGALTVEQMNSILEGIGWEPEITYAEMPMSEVSAFTGKQTNEVLVPDGNGGYRTETVTQEQDGGIAGNQMVRVPIIGDQATKAKEAGKTVGVMANFKDNKPSGGSSKGGGGGGSKKPEKQHWENPYDKLYNVIEEVEELQRDRNAYEQEFNDLMEDGWLNSEKINESIQKQAKNLSRELELQRQITAERKKQLLNLEEKSYTYTVRDSKGNEEEKSGTFESAWEDLDLQETLGLSFSQLFKYDEELGIKTLDVEALQNIVDNEELGEDQGALIEAMINQADEWIQSIEDSEDAARELERSLKELEDIGKEDAIEMENRVAEALYNMRDKEISSMESLSETLSESNASILSSLQESIDLERQIRDNTKKEEEIADMEARLALLRRDTSGGNQLEILQLEEQLDEAYQNYGDSLVDQELQRLSDENAKSEEQRKEQIDIARQQLEWEKESGQLLQKATNMLSTMSPEQIIEFLKTAEGFESLSGIQQMDWLNDTNNLLKGWKVGMKNWELEDIKDKEGTIDAQDEDGNALKLRYDQESGKWIDEATGDTYTSATWDEKKGAYVAYGKTEADDGGTPDDGDTPSGGTPTSSAKGYISGLKDGKVYKNGTEEIKRFQKGINTLVADKKLSVDKLKVDGSYGPKTKAAAAALQKKIGVTADSWWGSGSQSAFKKSSLKAYKTGGIADFTGPAWLDGTKSKPEIILNQQDSKNFIMLKDVLAEILQGATSGKGKQSSGGDNYFDISIIVDEISNDYDVDQMAERIKRQIYEDSTYRNVNTISLIR